MLLMCRWCRFGIYPRSIALWPGLRIATKQNEGEVPICDPLIPSLFNCNCSLFNGYLFTWVTFNPILFSCEIVQVLFVQLWNCSVKSLRNRKFAQIFCSKSTCVIGICSADLEGCLAFFRSHERCFDLIFLANLSLKAGHALPKFPGHSLWGHPVSEFVLSRRHSKMTYCAGNSRANPRAIRKWGGKGGRKTDLCPSINYPDLFPYMEDLLVTIHASLPT